MKTKIYISIISLLVFCGCSTKNYYSSLVENNEFKVVEVDGAAPERFEHGRVVTVAPTVKLNAGKHVLKIAHAKNLLTEERMGKEIYTLEIMVANNRSYALITENGVPKIVAE